MVTVRLTASLSPPTTRYDESPTAHGRVTNLGDQRHRARCAGVGFQNENLAVFDGVLHVHEAAKPYKARAAKMLAFSLPSRMGF